MGKQSDNLVGAVETTIEIMDAIVELDRPTTTEIADHLDMPISTTYSHLVTLEKREFVTCDERGGYQMGFRFLEIGGNRRNQTELYENAKSEIDSLADDTGDLANLVIEEHGRAVHLYLARGEKAVKLDSYPGMRSFLHTTATGKAILAHYPEERVREIIERHGLVSRTDNTITDQEDLFDVLERTRERGYALDQQERLKGLRCVAAPILIHEDELIGAVSVSGPVSRFDDDRFRSELPSVVSSIADVISINTEYS